MESQNNKPSKVKTVISYILRDLAFCVGIVAVVLIMNLIFGVSCPTKLIFDLDCPFCGMTRAHIAALRLDFKSAMEYHSLFFLGLPFLFLITHDELFKGVWKKIYTSTVIIMAVLFIFRYLIVLMF